MQTIDQPATDLRKVLPGLLLALLLAMLDSTIVSAALPTISGDLGGFHLLSWVVVAYLLTSTVTTPLWGKLSDLFGRKHLLQGAVVIFIIGSVLSGLSTSMGMLITFRALQGIGAGGLWVGVIAAIGVLAPPSERGKYQSYIAALSAVATVCGPLIGGVFADHGLWRWAFYINVPIGAVAFFIIMSQLHMPYAKNRPKIDYPGALAISVATVAIVLGTNWGGNQYSWGSPVIIALAVIAVLAIIAAVVVERRAASAIFPPHLFSARNFSLSLALGFLVGVALYSALTFLPVYQQSVHNFSATASGLLLLPLLGGMLVGSTWSGPVISKKQAYRSILGGGSLALVIGCVLLGQLGSDTSTFAASIYMIVFGFGLGLVFQNVMVVTQNAVELKDMGAASGALTYFRNVGGSFGVSLFAAVFGSRLNSYLSDRLSGSDKSVLTRNGGRLDSDTLKTFSSSVRGIYATAVAHGVRDAFRYAIPIFVIALILSLLLKPKKVVPPPAAPDPAAPPVAEQASADPADAEARQPSVDGTSAQSRQPTR